MFQISIIIIPYDDMNETSKISDLFISIKNIILKLYRIIIGTA